jgi:hypothetical protein
MTVAGEEGWWLDDEVVQLRARGGRGRENERPLAAPPVKEWTIGSSPDCSIQLHDPSGMVSRRHAILRREGSIWTVHDAPSRNGTRLDGERRQSFALVPGAELGIGAIELIAESARSITLREILDRWIGWAPERYADVDTALRAVRYMATMRSALVLRGEGDLVPLAARLHRQAMAKQRPFILAEKDGDGLAARHAATEGTLCVDALKLPRDWPELVKELRARGMLRARVIMCAPLGPHSDADAAIAQLPVATTIELPALASRASELARLVQEHASDAAADLGVSVKFREADWERLLARKWHGLAAIAHDARRLVVLREWGIVEGAARLGISHAALSRWAQRRRLATF